jgi:GntR family transcriptional repressor for pyruvate dehydrogenase complex
MDIQPVKQKTVVYQVVAQLKELIVSGSLKPGDKFPSELKLAEMFGVGRSTIREVMKIFQYIGIVEVHNPKGTFLSDSSNISSESLEWAMILGEKDISEVIELRMVMETQGLWYLLDYHRNDTALREKTIRSLDAEIGNIKNAIATGSVDLRLDADYIFHGLVIRVCENRIFQNLYQTMREFMKMEINFAQKDVDRLSEIPIHHEELLASIVDGDFNIATERFRHHIRNIDHLLESKLNSDPLT